MYSGQRSTSETMNKSSFTQTCNRFSQFLKERRSLGDFASVHNMTSSMLDINGSKPINTTMNLFPTTPREDENISRTGDNLKSLELFPLTSSFTDDDDSKIVADHRELPTSQEAKASASKMTIFYAGQVLVFDDLAEDEAQEIMSLASQIGTTGLNPQPQAQAFSTNAFMAQPNHDSILEQSASLSDLPIARRVSLHRFIKKRQDRIAAASPYQVHRNTEKYELMKQILQRQHKQELELKLF